MESQFSQRKKDSSSNQEKAALLLRDGMVFPNPSSTFISEARGLEKMGLLEISLPDYVLCVNFQDRDLPYSNRQCSGKIYINDGLDEAGDEYRCPECERQIYPLRNKKQRYSELHSKISPQGVKAYVFNRLDKLGVDVKGVAEGVYKVDLGDLGVFVCIVDYCEKENFLSRDWASENNVCYIVVNPRGFKERFLKEEWIARVLFSDIILQKVDLEDFLQKILHSPASRNMLKASVPVYSRGVLPIVVEPVEPSAPERSFVLEVGPNIVRLDGEVVIGERAGTQFQVFRILWDRFLDDLKKGLSLDNFLPMNVDDIAKELQKRNDQYIEDISILRRNINRLQTDIEKIIKKNTGKPIDRNDIIQSCRSEIQGETYSGYRINPSVVIIRPFPITQS